MSSMIEANTQAQGDDDGDGDGDDGGEAGPGDEGAGDGGGSDGSDGGNPSDGTGDDGEAKENVDSKIDSKNPNADGQLRTYTNPESGEFVGRARVIRMIEEMQDVDFQDDKGFILLSPLWHKGKCGRA